MYRVTRLFHIFCDAARCTEHIQTHIFHLKVQPIFNVDEALPLPVCACTSATITVIGDATKYAFCKQESPAQNRQMIDGKFARTVLENVEKKSTFHLACNAMHGRNMLRADAPNRQRQESTLNLFQFIALHHRATSSLLRDARFQ